MNIKEIISELNFVEANIFVSSITIRHNFTRIAIILKTNIKTEECTYISQVNQTKKEYKTLNEAISHLEKVSK